MYFNSGNVALLAALTGFLGTVQSAPQAHKVANPTVTIASGVVVGTATAVPQSHKTVYNYLGIPFAASPPLRFAPPTSPKKWTSPLNANTFQPACIQQFNDPPAARDFTITVYDNPGGPPPPESEDCLYLNIYAPKNASPSCKKSVLFWIYGGDLQFGDASLLGYNGSSFAAHQDVIVVAANYRTNVFGYSSSPQIPVGQQNVGYLDQRFALEWVQQNIGAFGGDPTKVTIFGESAGGYSVKQLLANPPKPLTYRAAILESEATIFIGNATANYANVVAHFGCAAAASPIDCLRKVSATDIKAYIEKNILDFAPANDQVTQTNDIRPNILSKTFAQVPTFFGTNKDEARPFVTPLQGSTNVTAADYVAGYFPGNTSLQNAVLAAYPTSLKNDVYLFAAQVGTDALFTCTTQSITTLLAATGYDTWRYFFNASFPNTQIFPEAGVYHYSEIAEVFGTYPVANELGVATTQQIQLSKYMQTLWANFAKHPLRAIHWPKITTDLQGVELGTLGSNGGNGEVTIDKNTVDYICAVYDPFITAQGY